MIFQGIDFVTISSNNHASPTGALPFVLPASSSKNPGEAVFPIPSTRIERWIRASRRTVGRSSDEGWEGRNGHADASASARPSASSKDSVDMRYEAYTSLLNCRIRNAYVGVLCSLLEHQITSVCFSSIRSTFLLQTSHPSSFSSTSILVPQTPLLDSLFPINSAPPPRPSFSSSHQSSM